MSVCVSVFVERALLLFTADLIGPAALVLSGAASPPLRVLATSH